MDSFEKWAREMIAKMEIVNDIAQETGKLNGEATKLLMMRAIEPYGIWKVSTLGSNQENGTSGSATMSPGLMEIVAKYGMTVDGVKVKTSQKVDNFKTLCTEMEKHGYEYIKGKGVFAPKWQGVKP